MHKSTVLLAVLACTGIAASQTSIVIPNGFATTEGNYNNGFPWSASSAVWPGLRTIQIYGPTNFTAQSVSGPISITRLRWRADGGSSGWTGGTFSTATVRMATAAVPYSAPSTTIAANFGPDLTTVYTGPVVFQTGATSTPGPWVVDITLTTPFAYDPANGGLAIDCDINNSGGIVWSGGTTPQLDVDTSPTTAASRVYISSLYPAANGTTYPHGNIIEVTYGSGGPGAASFSRYGTGCYSRAGSFYENFGTAAAFDLSNTALSMVYNGSNGYLVLPGITSFVTPSGSATMVANGDDVEQTVSLASALPVPGGSTSALTICSNGYVSTATGNGVGFSPSPGGFLAFPQTCWANWHDFNPLSGGAIMFEEVGSISYVTWVGVADYSGGGFSTFQYQFDRSNGMVHMVWQSMSALGGTGYLTGFHAGGSTNDPGSRDISATLAATFTTGPDVSPLDLNPSARPITGTTINLVTTQVPGNSAIGANILSFTQYNPGLDLTGIGMPGCSQYVGLNVTGLFIPSGGQGTNPLVIPNVPAYAGLMLFSQSAAFTAGANALGVISSNGVQLTVGTH